MLFAALVWTGNSATFVWTNPAGGNWSNPANWDLGGVPGPGDIAKITTSGNYTVTDDQDTAVGGIIVGNALPLAGTQNFLVAADVTLTPMAPITVNDNGTFTVVNGGTVDLANTAPLHLLGQGTNFGIIVLTNSNIYLYNDGTTANQPTATRRSPFRCSQASPPCRRERVWRSEWTDCRGIRPSY